MGRRGKTALFLTVAVLANSFGNLLLAMAMRHLPAFAQVHLAHYISSLVSNPFLLPGILLTATYTIAQLSMFSWADLSFVVPCLASSYVISTLLAEFIIGEHVQLARWLGVALITFGVILVSETPVATKPHHVKVHR